MRTIAVIFGGRSTEHDVSVITALANVIKPLELTKQFIVEPIYISKNGEWYWDKKLANIDLFSTGEIENFINRAPKVHLLLSDGLTIVKSSQFAGRKQYKKIDVVFPAMHGTHGEDGELAGVLEMANVPYVGCGHEASVISMDKVLAKQVTESAGISSTPWIWFFSRDLAQNHNKIIDQIKVLKYPLFVKPAHLGSSIGITKVESKDQLLNALEVASHYDNKVIVEQGVTNLVEVTLPIMGNEEPTPALLEQPLLHADDFFDFDAKYMQGGKKGKNSGTKQGTHGYSKLPANIPKDLYEKAVQLGLDVYKAVDCSGIARVDMLIDSKSKQIFFNEVNPMPGSLYSHNWNQAGMSNIELVTKLVDYSVARWRENQKYTTVFSTNYLKQF